MYLQGTGRFAWSECSRLVAGLGRLDGFLMGQAGLAPRTTDGLERDPDGVADRCSVASANDVQLRGVVRIQEVDERLGAFGSLDPTKRRWSRA